MLRIWILLVEDLGCLEHFHCQYAEGNSVPKQIRLKCAQRNTAEWTHADKLIMLELFALRIWLFDCQYAEGDSVPTLKIL